MPVLVAVGVSGARADPYHAVTDFDRRGRHVVGPWIERAAGSEIEARMVPMAGEDSVLDRAAMQRKAQVRATVIQREHAALVVHDDEWPVRPCCDGHLLSAQFFERTNADEFTVGHGPSLRSRLQRLGSG
jgi:hypothetical protein